MTADEYVTKRSDVSFRHIENDGISMVYSTGDLGMYHVLLRILQIILLLFYDDQ